MFFFFTAIWEVIFGNCSVRSSYFQKALGRWCDKTTCLSMYIHLSHAHTPLGRLWTILNVIKYCTTSFIQATHTANQHKIQTNNCYHKKKYEEPDPNDENILYRNILVERYRDITFSQPFVIVWGNIDATFRAQHLRFSLKDDYNKTIPSWREPTHSRMTVVNTGCHTLFSETFSL